ncbi:GFA family protein [Aureimonas fodinaquatilis]|uniref:GFA family protein n=1 Tax=Aureimonas fodinaquatilis TaxID=2565783 RepID=A0A5B0DY43_9HYPH|nr:GFA family protein [Aureimonas fodinaquatilis]KAA0970671.1 GFA family protein [Aureimonas fodinaquatilis]
MAAVDHPRLSGGCLCGNVRFSAVPEKLEMDVCHCSMCRKWSGGVFMAVPCGDSVEFVKSDTLETYKSSEWGERLFCRACGSSLFWRLQSPHQYVVAMHAFDDISQFHFAEEIFIDEKPAHYSFSNDTRKLTGAEVMAAFAAGQGSDNG